MKCSKCGTVFDSGRFCPECGNEITKEMVHQEKIEVARKYADEIPESYHLFHVKGNIPSTKINNAIAEYAPGLDRNTIIALYDTTISENGKEGFIFTDSDFYYKKYLEPAVRYAYADVDRMEYGYVYLKNGVEEQCVFAFTPAVCKLMNELLSIDKKYGIIPSKRKITKLDVMEKYGRKLPKDTCYHFYLKGTIPDKILNGALSKYANEVSGENVLGLIDITVWNNGKRGILFTKKAMYQNIEKDVSRKIYYKNIIDVEADSFYSNTISFLDEDSRELYHDKAGWSTYIKCENFAQFLKEMISAE